jgi:hypothetical protein
MKIYNIKNIGLIIVLALSMLVTSCSTSGTYGERSIKEDAGKSKIEQVDKSINNNNIKRLDYIGEYSYGIQYSLDQTNNIIMIEQLNKRIQSLSNLPSIEKMKSMELLVNELKTNNNTLLLKKDTEIEILQNKNKQLTIDKDTAVNNYIILAHNASLQADTFQVSLNEYKGWFGLKAVWLGLVQFTTTSFWTLIIIGVILLVLRIFTSTNPIAGAIFSIFNVIGGYFIKFIKVLIPKAVEYSGNIATTAYTNMKSLLTKIVDNIQALKDMQTKLGHDITLKELFVELDKSLDVNEKEVIDKIKKGLGY